MDTALAGKAATSHTHTLDSSSDVMANTAWYITGSDNTLWTDGGFFEMASVSSYATRAALPAMVRFGSMAKTVVGPLYITGSPTTAFRLDGGELRLTI